MVTGDCRDFDNWSNTEGEDDAPTTSQQCPTNEVMVGITKSHFAPDTSDDDWKYKIRCCKVSHKTLTHSHLFQEIGFLQNL